MSGDICEHSAPPAGPRGMVVTQLFATPAQPTQGMFNQQQFAELARFHELLIVVRQPERWPTISMFRTASEPVRVCGAQAILLPVWRPVLIGRLLNATLLHTGLRIALRSELPRWRPRFVLGSFAYPDGVAAVMLARSLGVPAFIKCHGSDINTLGRDPLVRSQLRWAFGRASGVIAVSRALIDQMNALDLANPNTLLLYNGVNRELFRPRDRDQARRELGLAARRRSALYVGNLKRDKGVVDLLQAFAKVATENPEVDLHFVGPGALLAELRQAAAELSLSARILIHGARSHEEVSRWLAACDILCLPSHAEGVPNVIVEAAACGRPVVATRVGGIPEIVTTDSGLLVPPRDIPALAEALRQALRAHWNVQHITRSHSMRSWPESARQLSEFIWRRCREEHAVAH